jgi:hypothetical protein
MKRFLIPLLMLALILSFPNPSQVNNDYSNEPQNLKPSSNSSSISEAGSPGNDLQTVAYMSREISNLQIDIANSFADATHRGNLSLAAYQTAGWTLYAAEVNANSITAIAEHETMGITPSHAGSIIIRNDTGLITDALYQQFYDQPHDGKLQNYTFRYYAPFYDTGLNPAWLVVRGDYSDPSTNITGWISPFLQNPVSDQTAFHDCSGDNAILSASTYYYVVIDGTGMQYAPVSPWFNTIWWWATGAVLGKETGYNLRGSGWDIYNGIFQKEAELNYVYIPWNTSSNSALTYNSGEQLLLAGNGTAQTGKSWFFTPPSNKNLTQIQFQTNQSVNIDYNITLWYKRTGTASSNWSVQTSGANVDWNATVAVSYPVLTGSLERYLNYSIQSDWTVQGLYNNTYSGTDYGHNSRIGDIVICTNMADETWTLTCSAPNYVTAIALSDSSDSSPITYYVDILVDMDIDATIEDGLGTPITGGLTNLTVLQSGSSIYKPSEIASSGGTASFTWNIDSTTSGNGTHYIEVFWYNGVEAGYLMAEVFVYYPTTLVSDDSVVNAYADNATAFTIGIDFDDTFLVRGLGGSLASVEYSFDGGANTTLVDQTGGRWTATVSTTGKINGTYQLVVYAEGYALENQSLTITVNLNYQTQTLSVDWSPTNNIPYLNSTKLSIIYREIDSTNITDAIVNVTFQGSTYNLAWDSLSQTYWIDLTGKNFTGVPGTFNLNVSAWKKGYEFQFDDTITITIGSQLGEYFDVVYSPEPLNISYIESLFIQVAYEYNSQPINDSTTVTITFNANFSVNLNYNSTSHRWETTLEGSSYFGTWTINVTASANGYTTRYEVRTFIVHEDNPIFSTDMPGFQLTTDYDTDVSFSLNVTDSIGTPINDAIVSFTAFGVFHSSTSGTNGEYSFTISPWATRGPHNFTVYVTRTGYVTSEMNLTITVEATTSLTFQLSSYQEYEQWNITINALYMDTFYSTPIQDASVNISLDGMIYQLEYMGYYYQVNITLNLIPGDYTIDAVSSALYAVSGARQTTLTVTPKRILHINVEFDPLHVVAGQFMQVRATLLTNETIPQPVPGFTIRFEISIFFTNGTSIHYRNPSMFDTTNTQGVATFGFDVPEGQIDRLTATAIYDGDRQNWSVEKIESTTVGANVLSLLFAFLMSDIGIMIILSIALLGIVAAGYNKGVKPKKRAAKLSLENQLQMFKDLETVQHFMAVYLDRGTCVFYHPFTDERIQPDLISGFIAAITSVYGEIKGDGVRGTLEEIQYHGLRLNSYSGEYIIGILILEGEMTPLLRERLQFFVELFENQYEKDLDGWTGLVDCFDPEWVVSTLNSAFNYAWHLPHRFGPTQKVSKTDARILDYISAVRDERNEFYLKDLLAPLAEMLEKTEAEVLDRLLYLQDHGIIVPIGIQTILQRQGLALVSGSSDQLTQPPAAVEEPSSIEEKPKGKGQEKAKEEPPEAAEELEFDEITEESIKEPQEEVVEKPETEEDEMESFVQDVESLLVAKSKEEKEEKKEDGELDKFVKELRAKIGEDEDEESQD